MLSAKPLAITSRWLRTSRGASLMSLQSTSTADDEEDDDNEDEIDGQEDGTDDD